MILEGKDTQGKVWALCQKAIRPDPSDRDIPHVAAVCVYPAMVPFVKQAVAGTGIHIASVATGFPSGQTFIDIKVSETRQAVAAGADEIDMVIDRGAFLSGNYQKVFDEIAEVKEACGPAHLKVILETGELANYDQVRKASLIAMFAGADFIKTSTGKVTTQRHVAGDAGDARSDPRFPPRHRQEDRHEAGRRHLQRQARARVPRAAVRDHGRRVDDSRSLPLRRVVAAQ